MVNTRVCLAALGLSLLTACLVSIGILSNGLEVFWMWGQSAPELPGGIAGAYVPDQFKIQQAEQQERQQHQQERQQQEQTHAAEPAGITIADQLPHQRAGQQQPAASTSARRHENDARDCAQVAESRGNGPVYYQQGLAQSLLSVPQPMISPYSPNLLYYSINADGQMLRQYLKRAGMPVWIKDMHGDSPEHAGALSQFHARTRTQGEHDIEV
eukprot:scaffold186201_cov18-Tisochrysis_lutea.AAC.1